MRNGPSTFFLSRSRAAESQPGEGTHGLPLLPLHGPTSVRCLLRVGCDLNYRYVRLHQHRDHDDPHLSGLPGQDVRRVHQLQGRRSWGAAIPQQQGFARPGERDRRCRIRLMFSAESSWSSVFIQHQVVNCWDAVRLVCLYLWLNEYVILGSREKGGRGKTFANLESMQSEKSNPEY